MSSRWPWHREARRCLAWVVIAGLGALLGSCRATAPAVDLLRPGDAFLDGDTAGRPRDLRTEAPVTVQLDDVSYRVLTADPPSHLRFRLRVSAGARLRFACGIPGAGGPVDFLVKIGRGGADGDTVWERRLEPAATPSGARWVAGDIDLGRWANDRLLLSLETRAAQRDGPSTHAVWAAPFVSESRSVDPLVVVYLVDALRADHTGPYGYRRKTTPALDQFAGEGVVFEEAVTQAPWTEPAVASLMTSLLPADHGVVRRGDKLSDRLVTLAETLSQRGWSTGAVVTNALLYAGRSGFGQGFDGFAGLHKPNGSRSRQVRAAHVVDEALSWIDARRGRPTFLYVHAMDPHWPYRPLPPFDRAFGDGTRPGEGAGGQQELRRSIDQYDGEIAYGDQEFGRFLRELRKRGLYDGALIVFLADHGEEFLDHGDRGHGRSLFDELIRIPLVVRFPHGQYGGRRIATQVQMVDVAPTIVRAAGGPPAPSFVGRPLQRVLEGDTRAIPALIATEHWDVTLVGVRTEKEKYIRQFSPKAEEKLFDLLRDPAERVDRAAVSAERVGAMRTAVEPILRSTPYRYVVRTTGGRRFSLILRTSGWFEDVAGSGLGSGERQTVEGSGQTLVLDLHPSAGKPREVRFRLRPMGAMVHLQGTCDGRPLSARDVTVANDRHPDLFPFLLPDPERAYPLQEAARLFTPPAAVTSGLQVWLAESDQERRQELDDDTLDALKALGYLQ